MVVGASVAVPVVYLFVRVLQTDATQVAGDLLRMRTATLLLNTLGLTLSVLAFAIVLALPLAYLTTHTDLPFRGICVLICVLPLAVPGYIMAYTILGLGGYDGLWHRLTGRIVVHPSGFWWALLALGLYNMPYMYLNLRAAMRDLDPSMTEAALSLGLGRMSIFFNVILPALRPALLAGSVLVSLHVISDFGVVSLLRFETFSLELYSAYTSWSPKEAAPSALVLIALAAAILVVDIWFLRGLRLRRATAGVRPTRSATKLGRWRWPAVGLVAWVGLLGVAAPTAIVIYWLTQAPLLDMGLKLWSALSHSLMVSLLAAAGTVLLALPIAWLGQRYPSPVSSVLVRVAFMGYAVPALAFALSLVYVGGALKRQFGLAVYPGLALLVSAYVVHYLAEAIGPIRSGLYLAAPRLEDASRGLGKGGAATMVRVTLPLLKPSLIAAAGLVFLAVMKELPLTKLLAPYGFDTLAVRAWETSGEMYFYEAAPYALCILLSAAAFVGVLMWGGRRRS